MGPSQATPPPATDRKHYAPATFEIHKPGKRRSARDDGDGVRAQAMRPAGRLVAEAAGMGVDEEVFRRAFISEPSPRTPPAHAIPKKIREIIADLIGAGFREQIGGGKGSHREFMMRTTDAYHKWVEWSDEDGVYLGKCPDLITGIQGDDPVTLYAELTEMLTRVGNR